MKEIYFVRGHNGPQKNDKENKTTEKNSFAESSKMLIQYQAKETNYFKKLKKMLGVVVKK